MWKTEIVHAWEAALLYVDGRFSEVLAAGRHRVWTLGRQVQIFRLPAYPVFIVLAPTEVLTLDRFGLRLGATMSVRIADPRLALEGQSQYAQKLVTLANEAVNGIAGERTLEALLSDRGGLGAVLMERLAGRVPELELLSVAISALVLPPETRRMLTEVERARREGEAALERARGEHAALRSLANAARLLKDNPDLMKLRTLQALSPTGKGATLVLGQDALAAPRAP